MKNLVLSTFILMAVALTFSSCDKDDNPIIDTLQGDEYLIKIDGEVYEEGKSLFAGIVPHLTHEEAMQAGITPILTILFEKSNYVAGKKLAVSLLASDNVEVTATGILTYNKNTANEDTFFYTAKSGTITIVSKKRIEFKLTCYRLADIDKPGATPFIMTGYVTESNPK